MIDAWLVVREERHVENKYRVCVNREDALAIAEAMFAYWRKEYDHIADEEIDKGVGRDISPWIYLRDLQDGAAVWVTPVKIREAGEIQPPEGRDE